MEISNVYEENRNARSFYEKMGFKKMEVYLDDNIGGKDFSACMESGIYSTFYNLFFRYVNEYINGTAKSF